MDVVSDLHSRQIVLSMILAFVYTDVGELIPSIAESVSVQPA
jgi:hypothetical protein